MKKNRYKVSSENHVPGTHCLSYERILYQNQTLSYWECPKYTPYKWTNIQTENVISFNNQTHISRIPKQKIQYLWGHFPLHLLSSRTIPICSIDTMCCLVLWVPPLQHNDPCVGLQKHSNATQSCNDANVSMLPVIVAIPYRSLQCIKPFKDVDDADDYGGVSNGVVVNVPVDSDFVVFVGPQEQSKNLYSTK